MSTHEDTVRNAVRNEYAKVAKSTGCTPGGGCCGPNPTASSALGYTEADLAAVPEGANMGLGCGNPQAIAALNPGEVVIDLGSGGGFDCFLAARKVGEFGKVIGVDMTPDMITKARKNAETLGASNVEFRLGEIENLPIPDETANVILSNCVVNLSPNKAKVFADAFRVLKPGGRLAISDVVATAPLPKELEAQAEALTGCISGAAPVGEIKAILKSVGFVKINVTLKEESREFIKDWIPGSRAEDYVCSATIEAIKPTGNEGDESEKRGSCCGGGCC
jgi:SAM-dependent methyltransferase